MGSLISKQDLYTVLGKVSWGLNLPRAVYRHARRMVTRLRLEPLGRSAHTVVVERHGALLGLRIAVFARNQGRLRVLLVLEQQDQTHALTSPEVLEDVPGPAAADAQDEGDT